MNADMTSDYESYKKKTRIAFKEKKKKVVGEVNNSRNIQKYS
jgi:hypothetical protein